MNIEKLKNVASMAAMSHTTGQVLYVGSAVDESIVPDENRLIIMVNEYGDRIARKSPGEDWKIDPVIIRGQYPNIPKSENAIKVDLRVNEK